MAAGDVVSMPSGKFNHILTQNPKSTVCGRFRPGGWFAEMPGVPLCKKCAGTVERDPTSRPLPDMIGKPLGAPLPRPQHDEYDKYRMASAGPQGSYYDDKMKGKHQNRQGQRNGRA